MKNLAEIMYEVRDAPTPAEQVKILNNNKSVALFFLLNISYSDNFNKLEAIPEYIPDDSPIGLSFTSLNREYRNIPKFLEKRESISLSKKQNMKLRNLLESLHWTESAFLVILLTKRCNELYNLSYETLYTNFPGEFEKCQIAKDKKTTTIN